MRELVLNYQGFRGKFHILEVRCDGPEDCVVAKQIQNRIGYSWGHITTIDRSQQFRDAIINSGGIEGLFTAADIVQLPAKRELSRGVDGTWYSLRIGDAATGEVISWWSDVETELGSVYALRDKIIETVMRLLRESKT